MVENHARVQCILAPLIEGELLLPCRAVAEVLGGPDLTAKLSTEAMMVRTHVCGVLNWHEQAVAIYSYEAIIGEIAQASSLNFSHCVLLKPYAANSTGYYAFALQGAPVIRSIRQGDLWSRSGIEHDLVSARVELEGKPVMIPNLPALATTLSQHYGRVLDNSHVFA